MTSKNTETVARAARVITDHHYNPRLKVCNCGAEWHPRHVAEQLHARGYLVEVAGDV